MVSNDKKVLIAEATPPSSLVTDAGKRAWLAHETLIVNMSIDMFNVILENSPKPQDLFIHFPDADPADVSECMWRLLDELFIEVTADHRVAVIGQDSSTKP